MDDLRPISRGLSNQHRNILLWLSRHCAGSVPFIFNYAARRMAPGLNLWTKILEFNWLTFTSKIVAQDDSPSVPVTNDVECREPLDRTNLDGT